MEINKMTFKTNITSEVVVDEIKSAFKSDKRIWSLNWETSSEGYILNVEAELESSEIIAKIN